MTLDFDDAQMINARETDELAITLMTFEHPDLAEPIRICDVAYVRLSSDPLLYGVVSNGLTFNFLPVEVTLPDDKSDGISTARLSMDNIGRTLVETVRSLDWGATVTIEVVSSIDLDDPIQAFAPLRVRTASIDAATVTLIIEGDPFTSEPFPSNRLDAGQYPALFS